jgi:acetyl/propionyl-CoA carboxylase alpha subunit
MARLMAPSRVKVRIGDSELTVEPAAGDVVRIAGDGGGDASVQPSRAHPGAYRVSFADRARLLYTAGDHERQWVFCDGLVYDVHIAADGEGSAREKRSQSESLSAPMPATVVRVVTGPGSSVSRGDALLVLEAMKMELPIRAPHDGVVKRVHCRVGELVQPGAPLLDFE